MKELFVEFNSYDEERYGARYIKFMTDREKIVQKWETSGLLDGLTGMRKSDIGLVLESKAFHYINEFGEEINN